MYYVMDYKCKWITNTNTNVNYTNNIFFIGSNNRICPNVTYVSLVSDSLEVYIPVNPLTKEQFVATMQHNRITSDSDTATRLFEVMVSDQKGVWCQWLFNGLSNLSPL